MCLSTKLRRFRFGCTAVNTLVISKWMCWLCSTSKHFRSLEKTWTSLKAQKLYLSNGSLFQKGLCDCLKLLMNRVLGKFDVDSLLTFNRWVKARTRERSVEKRFSAVSNSKPSSSSSSPELPDSFGSWLNAVERFVGRELLLKLLLIPCVGLEIDFDYLKRCIEWKRGSSVSLSRPIEVWRWILGKAPLVSSSESFSLKIELILLGRLTLLLPTLDCVVVDSDCSRLFGFGVTIPPPSTEIGMINSLGDFLIGCLSLLDVDCTNDWVGVVSDSFESFVDWRERGFLWTTTNNLSKYIHNSYQSHLWVLDDEVLEYVGGFWIWAASSLACGSKLVERLFCNEVNEV